MSAFTPYLQNKLLDHAFRGVAYTAPASGAYASLHTGDPGTTGASEVTGTNYARMLVPFASWSAATGGSLVTSVDVLFPTAGGAWGDVTWVGLWDALSTGNLLSRGVLPAAKTITSGDVFKITATNLSVLFS